MTIGQPVPRPDGPAKVTGLARYAADHAMPNVLHGVLVNATVAAGRVTNIDATDARAERGVAAVPTHVDMPRFGFFPTPHASQTFMPMQSEEIRYEGQPVAIVLAESIEAAEAGVQRVRIRYAPTPARLPARAEWFAIDNVAEHARSTGFLSTFLEAFELKFTKGDVPRALAQAPVRVESTYLQPCRHHNPMEPSAAQAVWEGDNLTLYDSTQHIFGVRQVLAALLRVPIERVRVISQHTGGGFGSKTRLWPHELLAAAAARITRRPVRIALRRADMYSFLGYQPRIAHRIVLAANDAGQLSAMTHDVVSLTAVTDDFVEFSTEATNGLYATPAMHLTQRVERANVAMPCPMRAPVEGPGTWALESAMDELAHRLKMDPLDLRLVNYANQDPATGQPWSSKQLREAYEEGARLFGWRDRLRARQRDGDWLIGCGMASCMMGTFRNKSAAQVRVNVDGSAIVATGTQDIGTGTPTILPQIAADVLGLRPEDVQLRMGDTNLPEGGPTYGSQCTMSTGAAVLQAARDARAKLARLAELPPDEVEMRDGTIRRNGADGGMKFVDVLRRAGVSEITGSGRFDPAKHGEGFSMRSFGAVFVEVGVDLELGLLRLRRAVGSYSAGRIINPRTARAQMIGGITWGWGMPPWNEVSMNPCSAASSRKTSLEFRFRSVLTFQRTSRSTLWTSLMSTQVRSAAGESASWVRQA